MESNMIRKEVNSLKSLRMIKYDIEKECWLEKFEDFFMKKNIYLLGHCNYVKKIKNKRLNDKKNKYYIGKSNYIFQRIINHINKKGAKWTQIHKFIEILDVYESNNILDEHKTTIQYMKEYGIENVRGGKYISEELDKYQLRNIKQDIIYQYDLCFKCEEDNCKANICWNVENLFNLDIKNILINLLINLDLVFIIEL